MVALALAARAAAFGCTADEVALPFGPCVPVDCQEKYHGTRSRFDSSQRLCVPAPQCTDDELYDTHTNTCVPNSGSQNDGAGEASHPTNDGGAPHASGGDSTSDSGELECGPHGRATPDSDTCECDEGWRTSDEQDAFAPAYCNESAHDETEDVGTGCTVDEVALVDGPCSPIDCAAKYNGTRSSFDASQRLCVDVPRCVGGEVYDAESTACAPNSTASVPPANNSHDAPLDAGPSTDETALDCGAHGHATANGSSCDCDEGWRTSDEQDVFAPAYCNESAHDETEDVGTGCTVDEVALVDGPCSPIDCAAKYNGTRSSFDASQRLCVDVPRCVGGEVYDAESTACAPNSTASVPPANNSHDAPLDAGPSTDETALDCGAHGHATANGSSCSCDEGWRTSDEQDAFAPVYCNESAHDGVEDVGTGCTVDEVALVDGPCSPIDCAAKYNGTRSSFDASQRLCVDVPRCVEGEVFVPHANACAPNSTASVPPANNSHDAPLGDSPSPDEAGLDCGAHGHATANGSSCSCDEGWRTSDEQDVFAPAYCNESAHNGVEDVGTGCTVDEVALVDGPCSPIDCAAKYNGTRSSFDASQRLCVDVPRCVEGEVFVPHANACAPNSAASVPPANNSHDAPLGDNPSRDEAALDCGAHGHATANGSSCECDEGWRSESGRRARCSVLAAAHDGFSNGTRASDSASAVPRLGGLNSHAASVALLSASAAVLVVCAAAIWCMLRSQRAERGQFARDDDSMREACAGKAELGQRAHDGIGALFWSTAAGAAASTFEGDERSALSRDELHAQLEAATALRAWEASSSDGAAGSTGRMHVWRSPAHAGAEPTHAMQHETACTAHSTISTASAGPASAQGWGRTPPCAAADAFAAAAAFDHLDAYHPTYARPFDARPHADAPLPIFDHDRVGDDGAWVAGDALAA